jgi:hypothetical protein
MEESLQRLQRTHCYVGIIFVKYGQQGRNKKFSTDDGVCLENRPKCNFCHLSDSCDFYKNL